MQFYVKIKHANNACACFSNLNQFAFTKTIPNFLKICSKLVIKTWKETPEYAAVFSSCQLWTSLYIQVSQTQAPIKRSGEG